MLNYDDLGLTELGDERMKLVIEMLTKSVYGEAKVSAVLEAAGLSPGDYSLGSARASWRDAVPDAARNGKLNVLVASVTETNRAFGSDLERRMRQLLTPSGSGFWYRCDDPFASGFVGAGAGRAVIDRQELRRGLQDLAAGENRVLIVTGEPGAGKTHSWRLIEHLQYAATMSASHRFIRVTTHSFADGPSGEVLAETLASRLLGEEIKLAPSNELDDTRIRRLLDIIIGRYPRDGLIRWIVLDGLDRPLVQETARDLARQLITLVSDSDLPNTRLIITGFDLLGLVTNDPYQLERIPPIDETLVSNFLATVASHLGCRTSPEELAGFAAKVLEAGGSPQLLSKIERAVIEIVRQNWARGPGDGDW